MDTITHGIAGALLSKAIFDGGDLVATGAPKRANVTTWVVVLGAVFPDADVARDFFSPYSLLMITWHRSITHSLVCLPVWAVLLGVLFWALARWRKWDAPSLSRLIVLFAVGILSHIFLDLVTTFGTMVWSPLGWSRPAWDVLFIVDFTFTALLLIPQLLAWAYEDPKHFRGRATIMWLAFSPAPYVISKIAAFVGAPISNAAIAVATALFALLFLFPAIEGLGLRVPYRTWNRAGAAVAVVYVCCAVLAHHVALGRVQRFAAREGVPVETLGALPLPPSLWKWDGLVRAPRGVYEIRLDLFEELVRGVESGRADRQEPLTHTYYPDAFSNEFIEKARLLPEVQKVLWFDRFPVTRFHREGSEAVVEFADLRFAPIRRDHPAAFTYRVRLSADGQVLSQGWMRR